MGVIERIMDDGISPSEWRAVIEDRPLLVSCSGGKDSTAVVLWLREQGMLDRCHFVFADTGWEHPAVYEYLDEVLDPLCAGRLVRVRSEKYPQGMTQAIIGEGIFPSNITRWCTRILKIEPIKAHLRRLRAQGHDVINVVGVRAAESQARSKLEMWDRGGPMGADVDVWRPLIDATVQDIVDIHTRHNVRPCSLYLRPKDPASRVGCYPCINSRKSEIRAVANNSPERIAQIRELERVMLEAAKPGIVPTFFRAKGGRNAGGSPIDDVVAWSRTSRGGKQFEMFLTDTPGCQMWGLCDMGDQ
jgi:3'-phosphoadenosine 5'-phosphosulfate sulfotransferase (PAPS reductase)/FAD synthetase